MSTTVSRFADPKDFFNGMFRKRAVCKGRPHQFHFLEDMIRNEFNLDEQELRKEKWAAYKRALDFIHQFDSSYDPLSSFNPFEKKIKFFILYFEDLMQTLKEKREAIMRNDPDRVRLVLAKPSFAKAIPLGDYVMHKKSKYSVMIPMTGEPSTSRGKREIEDVIDIQDSPKRQRVGKEVQTDEPLYSPSQSLIHIGDDQVVAKQLLQLGSIRESAYTYEETREGMPEEPPSAEMNLIEGELKGKELDATIKQASEEFLVDSNFFTIGAFMQFVWKQNME